jgi:hypothetical protein
MEVEFTFKIHGDEMYSAVMPIVDKPTELIVAGYINVVSEHG